MFRAAVSSCCSSGSGNACDEEDEFPMPMTSPKLTLSATSTTTAACSFSDMEDSESDSPPASERLKSQPFRRKDPAQHFQACVRGDIHELTKWVTSGGDPNARDEEGWTLLHHATMHGREECVQLLLRQGARHDAVSIGGHTVLHLASANRHCDVVKMLVEAGARVNVRNAHGNTPLHSAAATGTVDIMLYLLRQSANPDLANSVGEMPDQVCGATAEATNLVKEARRLKQARIAQRFALVEIHKLWNSGRAEPRSGAITGASATADGGEAMATNHFAAEATAAGATASLVQHAGTCRRGADAIRLERGYRVGASWLAALGLPPHGCYSYCLRLFSSPALSSPVLVVETGKSYALIKMLITFKSKLVAAAFVLNFLKQAPVMIHAVSTSSAPGPEFIIFLENAKNTIREIGERARGFFDDPIAATTRLLALAEAFKVRDMPREAGHKRHDCDELFERDRMHVGADEAVADGVQRVCSQMVKEFPEVGYNQLHLYLATMLLHRVSTPPASPFCVGGNTVAAAQEFPKWAVPVSWLMIIENDEGKRAIEPETIKAGVHGPAVTIFVAMSLLRVAEKQRAESKEEVVMVKDKVQLRTAAKTVGSDRSRLKALQEQAPITLAKFLNGYRKGMVDVPTAAE
eukprot:g15385.t1